jgi:hypothetical protein
MVDETEVCSSLSRLSSASEENQACAEPSAARPALAMSSSSDCDALSCRSLCCRSRPRSSGESGSASPSSLYSPSFSRRESPSQSSSSFAFPLPLLLFSPAESSGVWAALRADACAAVSCASNLAASERASAMMPPCALICSRAEASCSADCGSGRGQLP